MPSELLPYLLKSSFCLLAFYGLYQLLLRRETCFQYNRFYLLAATGVSLLLPFLEFPSFQEFAPLPRVAPSFTPIVVRVSVAASETAVVSSFSWSTLLFTLYGLGCGFFVFRFFRQLYMLRRFIRQNQHLAETRDGITYLPTRGVLPTFSFFRYIFWDDSQPLSPKEVEHILRHERVHVEQGHSYDLLYLETLLTTFWFNPLLHLYRKALMATHEYLADAEVIRSQDKTAYGVLLAKQVLHNANFTLGHYFNKSLTLKRLKMMQQPRRTPKFKFLVALPLLGLLIIVLFSHQLFSQDTEKSQPQGKDHALTPPEFPGGKKELSTYILRTLRYPAVASQNNIFGSVFIQAILDKEGKLGNFKVLQSSHPALEKEALRSLQNMPKWKAGKVDGKTATSVCVFPFSFKLDGFQNNLDSMEVNFRKNYMPISGKVMNKQLDEVVSGGKAQAFKILDPVVVIGYGPIK